MTLRAGDRIYDPLSKRFGLLCQVKGAIGFVAFNDQLPSEPVYLGGIQPARPALDYGPPRLVARDGVRVERPCDSEPAA